MQSRLKTIPQYPIGDYIGSLLTTEKCHYRFPLLRNIGGHKGTILYILGRGR